MMRSRTTTTRETTAGRRGQLEGAVQSEVSSGPVIRTNKFGVYTTSIAMPHGCMYVFRL